MEISYSISQMTPHDTLPFLFVVWRSATLLSPSCLVDTACTARIHQWLTKQFKITTFCPNDHHGRKTGKTVSEPLVGARLSEIFRQQHAFIHFSESKVARHSKSSSRDEHLWLAVNQVGKCVHPTSSSWVFPSFWGGRKGSFPLVVRALQTSVHEVRTGTFIHKIESALGKGEGGDGWLSLLLRFNLVWWEFCWRCQQEARKTYLWQKQFLGNDKNYWMEQAWMIWIPGRIFANDCEISVMLPESSEKS